MLNVSPKSGNFMLFFPPQIVFIPVCVLFPFFIYLYLQTQLNVFATGSCPSLEAFLQTLHGVYESHGNVSCIERRLHSLVMSYIFKV